MAPEAGLDVTSQNPRLFRLNNENREQVFEVNEVENVGLNIEASPNHETFIIKPVTTSAFEEVLEIRNNAGLFIFAVEEGHIGIQTYTPKTKLHVAIGNGNGLATHGDFILGNLISVYVLAFIPLA